MLTVQQAAETLLKEFNQPLSSKELAKLIIDRNLVSSSAKEPELSFAQTLERNIRMNSGNNPRLEFVQTSSGRKITLPSIQTRITNTNDSSVTEEITIRLPKSIINKINIINQINNNSTTCSIEDTIIFLLKKGILTSAPEILNQLKHELEDSLDL
ncbi:MULTISPECIES: winged helix-turn-helix domain-containing protein [Paenibacillus]|uniref:HTH HARE-type domain-containing protein n=1 Tax=Paenibacillus albilobatus TaxID=2716884 RepID=A0A920CCM1_9BACL|nr:MULTISPECIES: winged helix-turn-helix domain-containing protein [Paenibacillus]MDR9856209.1 winged helix-turn-helix domain-containing protein [Paenibacillus sp. VCA1]GIO31767.1 hypothetical protein J2TS6_29080 [Paenibacillus albilobatus]